MLSFCSGTGACRQVTNLEEAGEGDIYAGEPFTSMQGKEAEDKCSAAAPGPRYRRSTCVFGGSAQFSLYQ